MKNINTQQIISSLIILRQIANIDNLERAIYLLRKCILTDEQKEALNFIADCIDLAAVGQLNPPVDLYQTYERICERGEAIINERRNVERRKYNERRKVAI